MRALSYKTQFNMRNIQLLLVFIFFIIIINSAGAGAGADVDAFACGSASGNYPFCRSASSTAERVKDLIGRLTLQEKVRLLVNNAAAVPRLGIKGYEWWSEALHGVSDVGPGTKFGGDFPGATSFPQVITTAATFNASLWEDIGKVVSDEARAMYNGGAAGLTYWSPNVNIFRDPRWGRGQETPGEDPIVAATYATSYVRGLQGNSGGEERLKVAACCKHHTAYDLDNWKGVDRFHFNAKVSAQDMEDTYSVPFKSCVKEGKVASVMCSYNQVNGVPTCADPHLLRHTIRHSWSLQGYIVSDCDSVAVFFDTQHYTRTPEEAAAAAIKAGLDLNCGPFLAEHTEAAVEKGVLNESDVDGALSNTLAVQMRLGMFDSDSDSDSSSHPHSKLGPHDVCTPKHQHLALHAARQGIVLLKNHRATLPLSPKSLTSVALIGPNSNATATMIGNYAGVPCKYTSPLQGIGKYARTIFHNEGCSGGVACEKDDLFGEAIEAAGKADATILVMGLDQSIEAEFLDRVGLLLPGRQQELITKVAAASKGPTILVLMSGGPIDVSFAQNDDRIAAILWAGYPGQAGGAAIADVLFGAHNPGGRLPMTWYPESYLETLPMTRMDMRANASAKYPGRTYRFYKGEVVYPFGHGLSYTTFKNTIVKAPELLRIPSSPSPSSSSSSPRSSKKLVRVDCRNLTLRVHVEVENTGSMDGTHTLLMYTSPPRATTEDWAPQKQLVAFQSLYIPAGGKKRVELSARVCKHLSVVDGGGVRRIPMGKHRLHIGDANHLVSLHPHSHLISS